MAEVPQTIRVQAVQTNGVAKTSGGDRFVLRIEQRCTLSDICCRINGSDNVPGLPFEVVMNDNGNGTYEYTYTIRGGGGSATVSVFTPISGGSFAQYWTNFYRSGDPAYCFVEGQIDNYWYDHNISPLS